jgi:DNA invertase Pin-like site-specific DNA recombinase
MCQYVNPSMTLHVQRVVAPLADTAKCERDRMSRRTKLRLKRATLSGKRPGRPKGSRCIVRESGPLWPLGLAYNLRGCGLAS